MNNPAAIRTAAPHLEGHDLDDVLFNLFEEFAQNRAMHPGRIHSFRR